MQIPKRYANTTGPTSRQTANAFGLKHETDAQARGTRSWSSNGIKIRLIEIARRDHWRCHLVGYSLREAIGRWTI